MIGPVHAVCGGLSELTLKAYATNLHQNRMSCYMFTAEIKIKFSIQNQHVHT